MTLFPVRTSSTPGIRLRRFLGLGSYLHYSAKEYSASLHTAIENKGITHVFINCAELMRFGAEIKKLAPTVKVIILSHGNKSGDDLYEISGRGGMRNSGFARLLAIWQLGCDLTLESHFRQDWIDMVCVMSNEEEVLDRWLGARNTIVLPRLVSSNLLPWSPIPGRVGYVGTLNHTPNLVALESVCEALVGRTASNFKLRVVGQPQAIGKRVAEKFPFVEYLGALDENDLAKEVSTWNVFLNPILWLSRGASMKFAKAVGWGLPVLSTRNGVRGYEYGAAEIPISTDDARDFANSLLQLLSDTSALEQARQSTLDALKFSPSVENLSSRLQKAAGLL